MTEPFCEDYIYLFETKSAACKYCVENNMLFPMFFLISFIPFTILFSSWVVAKFVFLPHVEMSKNEKEIEWPEEEEIVKYEEKYPIIEKNVKNEDLDTDNCCVCESTPDGLVFMKYNKKNEIFDWWGDNKSVSYKYLETVARKYVNSFKCSNFYIDREEDLKEQIEKEKVEEEREKMEHEDKKEEEVDSDDDLFVKLKPNEKIKPKKKGKRAAINGNNYKYCGKIKDFKLLKKIENKKNKKKLDFSSWKSMLNN
tara:strand:- start:225 stop:986 length:762 start_codon:yes stop_codon:yes gene_type:complete